MKSFASRLRQIRRQRHLSQSELARMYVRECLIQGVAVKGIKDL